MVGLVLTVCGQVDVDVHGEEVEHLALALVLCRELLRADLLRQGIADDDLGLLLLHWRLYVKVLIIDILSRRSYLLEGIQHIPRVYTAGGSVSSIIIKNTPNDSA